MSSGAMTSRIVIKRDAPVRAPPGSLARRIASLIGVVLVGLLAGRALLGSRPR
jgi:hypothetical protein